MLAGIPSEDLVRFVEDVGHSGQAIVTDQAQVTGNARDRRTYAAAVGGVAGWAAAPIRRGDELIGVLASTRDAGSEPHSAADLAALCAAAYPIGLRFDALAARRSESSALQRWEAVFSSAAIGMSVVGADGLVQEVNEAACAIFGREPSALVGHPWSEFAHPDDIVDTAEQLRALNARELASTESVRRILRPDGQVRLVRVTRTASDSGTGASAVFSQFNDVTDQYAAEKEADRFGAVVHSSPDFVAMSDLESRVLFLNAAGRAMVRLPADVDVRQTRLDDYVAADTQAQDERPTLSAVRRFGNVEEMAALRDWQDGSAIPVWASTFLVDDVHTGEPIAVATVRRDLRDQLAVQRTLESTVRQRSQLLTELVAAEQNERERIAEDVHDESVQLLAAAHLRLQLLGRQIRRDDVQAAGEAVDDVTDLVVSSLDQLRRLLVDLEPTGSHGSTLADSLRLAAERLFAGTSVRVTVEGTLTGVPPEVVTVLDRGAREALSNARRHARARRVAVRLHDRPGAWHVEVHDDGVGLPDELPAVPGHLGLRAMISRIEALGGECTAASAGRGGGTRVTMRVPMSAHAAHRAPPSPGR